MKALWWFEENAIAGMARPGFNACQWFDLPMQEGVLLGWLGQFSEGPAPLAAFREHLNAYAPKVFPFFRVNAEEGAKAMRVFDTPAGLLSVAERLGERTKAFGDFSVRDDTLSFRVSSGQLAREVAQLKKLGVRRIVALTEHHHQKDTLAEHFMLDHFSIQDLHAPRPEHAVRFSEILLRARERGEIVAVHCLAGIGRTSTMLIAAHLILGESLESLKARIAKRNPTFVMMGSQAEFIHSIASGRY